MKNFNKIVIGCFMAVGITSCSLDSEVYQYKDTSSAFTTVKDVFNGMNGAYYALGHYGFLGNYAIAYGDMSAGICEGSQSSGHFASISTYTIADTESEFSYTWEYGYKVVDRTTRTILGAKGMMENLTEGDKTTVNNYVGQCYALRALANYYLVNIFALPYSAGTENAGIPLVVDKPIEAFETVTRSTVGETYKQILSDIESAEGLIATEDNDPGAFYMNMGAVSALKARVYMSMGEYDKAKEAALAAIAWRNTGDGTEADNVPTNAEYLAMWTLSAGSSVAESKEDIFTIKKTADDNLSANSLNTLYGSYYGTVTNSMRNYFDETDIRAKLMTPSSKAGGYQPQKFAGITGNAAVANIPVFRKSEMSLIIAEVYARANDIKNANKYLMYTAKRNSAYLPTQDEDGKEIEPAKKLPTTKEDLLAFISAERIREFFSEGHCFYDARRMGDKVSSDTYSNFDIAKFVFPIPADEINSGSGIKQNSGWEDNLPQ